MIDLKKLGNDHWNYTEDAIKLSLRAAAGNDILYSEISELMRFLYLSAFFHGWKHAMEATEECKKQAQSVTQKTDKPTQLGELIESYKSFFEQLRRQGELL